VVDLCWWCDVDVFAASRGVVGSREGAYCVRAGAMLGGLEVGDFVTGSSLSWA